MKSPHLFWQGTASAVGAGLLAFGCAKYALARFGGLLIIQMSGTNAKLASTIIISFALLFYLANIVWMGLAGSFFWHRMTARPRRYKQLLWVLIPYYSFSFVWFERESGSVSANYGVFGLLAAALFYATIATLFSCWPLDRSIQFGSKWWPKRRYRHFFGLTNDYERDEETKSP